MKRLRLSAILTLVLSIAFAVRASAQFAASFAQLNGVVRDASGSVLVGATMTLRNVDTNRPSAVVSGAKGWYVFPSLLPGTYQLTAGYRGFSTQVRNGIELRVGESATVDVLLAVAAHGEHIEI